MTEQEFRKHPQYDTAIWQGDAVNPIRSEYFAETIDNTMVQEIGS